MYLTEKETLEQSEKIRTLEDQIKALKKWIKYNTDVDIEMEGLIDQVKEMDDFYSEKEEQTMTPSELEQYVRKIEMYSDVFNYGRTRVEERKVAENL